MHYRPQDTVNLLDNFDSIFDNFYGQSTQSKGFVPSVDISETEDAYLLEADLPGFAENDIDVKVENDVLTVSSSIEKDPEEEAEKEGENGNENEKTKTAYLVKERKSRSFSRAFVLPKDVDSDGITAKVKKGILNLVLPKSEKAKPRTIKVNGK